MSATTPVLLRGVRKHPSGPGYQVRIEPFDPLTLPTPDEANAYSLELRRLKAQGIRVAPSPVANGDLLRDHARDWLGHLETVGGKQGRPYTAEGMKAARRDARPWLGEAVVEFPKPVDGRGISFADLPLSAIAVGALDVYFEHRYGATERGRAAVGEWQSLRGILELAQRRGVGFDPRLLLIGVKRRKSLRRVPLTWTQLHFMSGYAPEHMRRVFPLGQTLGGRIMELLQADESWLDLKRRTFTIPAWARKNGETGDLVLDLLAEEVTMFRQQLVARGGPSTLLWPRKYGTAWKHSHFYRQVIVKARSRAATKWREQFDLAADAATPFEWLKVDEHDRPVLNDKGAQVVAGIQPHDLRRGAATMMIEAKVPADLVALRLGHKDAGQLVVHTYAHTRRERMRAELDRIDEAGGLAAVLGA